MSVGKSVAETILSAEYQCVPLNNDHFVMDFDCGHGGALTDWLINQGMTYQTERLARVWVMVKNEKPDLVRGYFTLSSHQIQRNQVTKKDSSSDPSKRTIVASLPALPTILLGKFAVDKACQGTGLAGLLMSHVYLKFLEAAQASAAKFLVLDTHKEKLVEYYKNRYGFVHKQQPDADGLMRMYKKATDIENDIRQIQIEPSAATASALDR